MVDQERKYLVTVMLACEYGSGCPVFNTCSTLDKGYAITVTVPQEEVTSAGVLAYLEEYVRGLNKDFNPCIDSKNSLHGGPVGVWLTGSFEHKNV